MSSLSPLTSALDIEWILEEPCLVTWDDSNNELKNLGLEPHPITLWIGVHKTNRVWVAMLKRTIAFGYGRRSKPFDFFVFLDSRSFRLEKEPVIVSSPLKELLQAHQNKPQRGWLSGCIPLGQLQTPGKVLMKQQLPQDKAWDGMPLHLLMEIESFAKAPAFNIYVSNKKKVYSAVNRLQNELPKTPVPVRIDLDKVYEGRSGAWDAWGLYSPELVGRHKPDTSESTVAPPRYSVIDPNAARATKNPSTPRSPKRPHHSQEHALSQKRIKEDRASQWDWVKSIYPAGSPTEENTPSSTRARFSQQSTVDEHSLQKDQPTHENDIHQSAPSLSGTPAQEYTQDLPLTPGSGLVLTHPRSPDHHNFHDLRSIQTPPYAPSLASTASLDRLEIKPTIFTTRPQAPTPATMTLTLTDLERLITTTIQAQIPAIAAQVQTHNLTTELTAWVQPSIADYITTHMPAIMHEAVSTHVSDVNDEFECASASLHETKDEAITEIKSAEESGIEEIHRESQVALEDLQEHSQRLSGALDDQCTELEDRLDAKLSSSETPVYASENSTKEAVKLFERFHRGPLSPDEQVKVLLSIAKFRNAEVFVAADRESQRMLVAHWSDRKDYVPPPSPLPHPAE